MPALLLPLLQRLTQAKVIMRGIRHKVLDQLKKKKDSFPEDDVHQRMKEVSDFLSLVRYKRCATHGTVCTHLCLVIVRGAWCHFVF